MWLRWNLPALLCYLIADLDFAQLHRKTKKDSSVLCWHQSDGLLCWLINLRLVSDDLCRNNSHSHTPPNPINESVTPMCHTLRLTDVEGRQLACCDPREAVFQVGFPQPESPFKQNATTPQQARKLLSVKSSRGVENVLQAPLTHSRSRLTAVSHWEQCGLQHSSSS